MKRRKGNMMKQIRTVFLLVLVTMLGLTTMRAAEKGTTIKGYVIDSACTFTKNLKKPVSPECAVSCAKNGSPLVILTDAGTIYWPIADEMPAKGQNDRLVEFAGKKVSVTGKVFVKGGSHAIVIEKIGCPLRQSEKRFEPGWPGVCDRKQKTLRGEPWKWSPSSFVTSSGPPKQRRRASRWRQWNRKEFQSRKSATCLPTSLNLPTTWPISPRS